MEKHTFIVERTSTGYSATYEPGGIYAGGKTIEELNERIVKALNDGLERSDLTLDNVAFKYDLRSFFEANGYLNAAGLAREIGMTKSLLTQYMSGNKKPSPTQAKRIFDGVHKLGRQLAEMEFAY